MKAPPAGSRSPPLPSRAKAGAATSAPTTAEVARIVDRTRMFITGSKEATFSLRWGSTSRFRKSGRWPARAAAGPSEKAKPEGAAPFHIAALSARDAPVRDAGDGGEAR